MTVLTVDLDESALAWLRHRAQREGIEPATLAARLLAEASAEPDPFDFIGSFASDAVVAREADTFLTKHGFGET